MNEIIKFMVDENHAGERLDKVIDANVLQVTRSYVQRIIKEKGVAVDDTIVKDKNYKVRAGQKLTIVLPEPEILDLMPEDIPIDIVYEDDDLLVVNKAKGMVVHPAAGNFDGTLVNALMHYCRGRLSSINGTIRPGIVHRIDKDTSGLLIVAKNDFAHKNLADQIKDHNFSREYEAVVYESLKNNKGTVDAPIGRNKNDRKKMAVTCENSKNAITHYKVLNRYDGFTHLRLRLETGRTHQIRVHMAHIGHQVAGDYVYGPKKIIKSLNGQCLHAKHIGFVHPRTSKYIEFESDLPDYFKDFLNAIKKI